MDKYHICSLSDRAILVSFGETIDLLVNERVLHLHRTFQKFPFEGFIESAPAFASLAVYYDIKKIKKHSTLSPFVFVKNIIEDYLSNDLETLQGGAALIRIPVCYDMALGRDIAFVADQHHLSISEVIAMHTARIYQVYMIGFMPGFAYMGTVDERIVTPRKAQPEQHVKAGSVGIAGAQTGIYPIGSPGGWQIIGQTPVRMFDPAKSAPCFLSPGNQVQFYSINIRKFNLQNEYPDQ